MKILSEIYLLTRKSPLNVGSNPDPELWFRVQIWTPDPPIFSLADISHLWPYYSHASFSLSFIDFLVQNFSASNSDHVYTYCLFVMCSVAHTDVTQDSAKLTNNLKSFTADQEDVSVTYTYSVTFIVSQSYLPSHDLLYDIMLSLSLSSFLMSSSSSWTVFHFEHTSRSSVSDIFMLITCQ